MSSNSPKLALYYFDACPYCQRVLAQVAELKVEVELCNTFITQEHAAKLYRDTGRTTVPCLYIDNKPMHESKDIIKWLNANVEQLTKIS
ncbi:MAG: hypothetical protein HN353_06115 [Bdellovibrionales bacterium]|jgi:glutaredoxin 3|nr:hypothetical protein [Bdellovibrionales bacterium]MBT7669056.1 hypothetical protein [Bdellovibrionales bacterium]MBT7768046.1 hypothetical protein [Bdellovibrionales bacterium]